MYTLNNRYNNTGALLQSIYPNKVSPRSILNIYEISIFHCNIHNKVI